VAIAQRRRWIGLAICALGIVACAHTSMSSVAAPSTAQTVYGRILVVFDLNDLGLRREGEDRFHGTSSTVFIPSYRVFMPGQQYTKDEMTAALKDQNIDAVLIVKPGAAGAESTHVPGTLNTQCTAYSTEQGCLATQTTVSGAYDYSKPWATFTAKLVARGSERPVWVATASSGGNAFANAGTLVRSVASKTISQLIADGVIAR
jgi:hypothetical protein